MPYTEIEGTEAIGATEWSLATDTSYDAADARTTQGTLQVWLDLADMVAGDQLRLRIYEKVRSASTQRRAKTIFLTGPQPDPIWVSIPFGVMHGWDVTAQAISGTITVDWSLRLIPVT